MHKNKGKWRASHIFQEAISCQKDLTRLYNLAATEGSSQALRQDFLRILDEEHQLHENIIQVMQRRGLYTPHLAQSKELAMTQQHFSPLK